MGRMRIADHRWRSADDGGWWIITVYSSRTVVACSQIYFPKRASTARTKRKGMYCSRALQLGYLWRKNCFEVVN